MEKVICKACLSEEYYTQVKYNNLVAYCADCGKYIKNIPQGKPPQFYFGKWKGTLINECNDLSYLVWAQKNLTFTEAARKEIIDRINQLREEAK